MQRRIYKLLKTLSSVSSAHVHGAEITVDLNKEFQDLNDLVNGLRILLLLSQKMNA